MSGYLRNGIIYNSENEANLAAVIPSVYLDRPLDAGYIAEAILDSGWLRRVQELAWAEGRRDSTDLVSDALGFRVVARNADNPYQVQKGTEQ